MWIPILVYCMLGDVQVFKIHRTIISQPSLSLKAEKKAWGVGVGEDFFKNTFYTLREGNCLQFPLNVEKLLTVCVCS